MLNVGAVQAFATLNDKGFESGIKNLKKKGERFSKDMQKNFDKIGRSLTSIGSKMTATISAPLLGAGALAVKTAANYETLRTSMDILNGSVEEGARNFERLKEFSAQTPFQLGDLAKAQNMLQGFGMEADDAYKSIKMIGDISAVSGGSIEGIGIAFGQAAAEGKLMTRDVRQLINQGVPAIKLLADTMGVAQSEIFDLASQGKISFDILNQAFEEATSEGGMFADGMKKQAKTIGGVFSTLKDNVSLALGELGQTIVEELDLKRVIGDLISNIQAGVKWFNSLDAQVKKMGIAFTGLAIALGPVITGLGIISMAAAAISGPVLAAVAGIGLAATLIIKNWDSIVKYFRSGDGAKIWDELKELVQNTVSIVKRIWDVFGGNIMRITKDSFGVIVEVVEASLTKINNAVKFWAKVFNGDIKGALGIAVDDFKDSFGSIESIAKSVGKLSWSVQPARIWASTIKNIFSDAEDDATEFVTIVDSKLNDGLRSATQGAWYFGQGIESAGAKSEATKQAVEALTNSYKNFSVAAQKVNDTTIFDPAEIDKLYLMRESVEGLYTPLSQLMNIPINIPDKMAPPGSFGYMQESLANLREQLRVATDPEVIARLQTKIKETEEGMAEFQGQAEQGGQAMMGLANSIGNMFSQAVLHGQNLGDVVKNLLKQLASRAFVTGIGALLTGGASLGGGSFLSALFGGMFHGGGVVPGSGDKMIRAKGGEMVLTQSQQKALGGMQKPSMSISGDAIGKAVGRELDKRIRGVSDRKIFEMAEQGRYR